VVRGVAGESSLPESGIRGVIFCLFLRDVTAPSAQKRGPFDAAREAHLDSVCAFALPLPIGRAGSCARRPSRSANGGSERRERATAATSEANRNAPPLLSHSPIANLILPNQTHILRVSLTWSSTTISTARRGRTRPALLRLLNSSHPARERHRPFHLARARACPESGGPPTSACSAKQWAAASARVPARALLLPYLAPSLAARPWPCKRAARATIAGGPRLRTYPRCCSTSASSTWACRCVFVSVLASRPADRSPARPWWRRRRALAREVTAQKTRGGPLVPARRRPPPRRAPPRGTPQLTLPHALPAKPKQSTETNKQKLPIRPPPRQTKNKQKPCPSSPKRQLVPAVTELMVAELLYLEKQGATMPIEMLINSSGTTRQDGEIVSWFRRPFLAAAAAAAAGGRPSPSLAREVGPPPRRSARVVARPFAHVTNARAPTPRRNQEPPSPHTTNGSLTETLKKSNRHAPPPPPPNPPPPPPPPPLAPPPPPSAQDTKMKVCCPYI